MKILLYFNKLLLLLILLNMRLHHLRNTCVTKPAIYIFILHTIYCICIVQTLFAHDYLLLCPDFYLRTYLLLNTKKYFKNSNGRIDINQYFMLLPKVETI